MPSDLVNAPVCMMVSAWNGYAADARSISEQLRSGASNASTEIRTLPYLERQSLSDAFLGPGSCNYTKGGYLGEITGDCIDWQTGGVCANFLAVGDENRVREAYRGGKYERLATIKAKHDPKNIVNSHPNILPANVLGRQI